MPAPESTKFQVNYSLPNGTLVNIYATTVSELEAGLADLAMNALNIRATGSELAGGVVAPAPAAAPTVAAVAAAFNATPVAAASAGGGAQEVRDRYGNLWIYNHPEAPECARGKMVLKHGTAQATGKPYKGWFDPAAGPQWAGPKVPKEEQFQTIWAQRMRRPDEFESPSCATVGGDFWFPEKGKESIGTIEVNYAKQICRSCPHQTECAEWGIINEAHGIWGGLVSRERYKIRRRRGITLQGGEVA